MQKEPKVPESIIEKINKCIGNVKKISYVGKGSNSNTFKIDIEGMGYKFLIKIPKSSDEDEIKSFSREIGILKSLNHNYIPKIIMHGDEKNPYYMTIYVDGKPLSEEDSLKGKSIIKFIEMILSATEYLHNKRIMHGDLHGGNIIVGEDLNKDGIAIIDFGRARYVDAARYISENWSKIAEILSSRVTKKDVSIGSLQRKHIKRVAEDLKKSDVNYNIEQIKNKFRGVINPHSAINTISELDETSQDFVEIPLYGMIYIPEPVIKTINLKEFQRLQCLKQLSFCEYEFPGATHTRYEHSIGVYYIASRIIKHLSTISKIFSEEFKDYHIKGFLMASLLHDIGHYPYAHPIEQFVEIYFPKEKIKKLASHHKKTIEIIERIENKLKNIWDEESVKYAKSILLSNSEAEPFASILDSNIDIDKIDYVARDSYHCGKEIGFKGGDIIKHLLIDGSKKLSIKNNPDSVTSISIFLVHMSKLYRSVYWSKNVRSRFASFFKAINIATNKEEDKLIQLIKSMEKCRHEHEAFEEIRKMSGQERKKDVEKLLSFCSYHMINYNNEQTISRDEYIEILNISEQKQKSQHLDRQVEEIGKIFQKSDNIGNLIRVFEDSLRKSLEDKGVECNDTDILIDKPPSRRKHVVVPVAHTMKYRTTNSANDIYYDEYYNISTKYTSPLRVYVNRNLLELMYQKNQSKIDIIENACGSFLQRFKE